MAKVHDVFETKQSRTRTNLSYRAHRNARGKLLDYKQIDLLATKQHVLLNLGAPSTEEVSYRALQLSAVQSVLVWAHGIMFAQPQYRPGGKRHAPAVNLGADGSVQARMTTS